MRLTLRTMLAYVDGILEPDDAEDLRRRIEESEVATELMQRIRDVVQRLRLAAPSVHDGGPQLDANTVAEYLDYTLPAEQVPDFEKICLESDIHLAEVASCHQILTLILGEPAEIDPESRTRMYVLPQLRAQPIETTKDEESAPSETQEDPPPVDGDSAAAATPPPPKPRPKSAVPDYLRESKKKQGRLLPVAVAMALMAMLCVLGLMATGQIELAMFTGSTSNESNEPRRDDNSDPQSSGNEVSTPPIEPPAPPAPEDAHPPTMDGTPIERSDSGKLPGEIAENSSSIPEPGNITPVPADLSPEEPGGDVNLPDGPGEAPLPPAPAPSEPGPDIPGIADAALPNAMPDGAGNEPPLPSEDPVPEVPGPEEATAGEEAAPEDAEPTLPPQLVGKFVSDGQIMLRSVGPGGIWQRLHPNGDLQSGTRLASMPTYSNQIEFESGVALQLIGGGVIELLPPTIGEQAGLKISYGRLLLTSPKADGTRMRLTVGEQSGTIVFPEANSQVALEVSPISRPDAHPEKSGRIVTISLFAASGRVQWETDPQRRPIDIEQQNLLSFDGSTVHGPNVADTPDWIDGEDISSIDQRASKVLSQSLSVNGSAKLGLFELAEHRLVEVRWLASRCLACVDEFGPMVPILNDPIRKLDFPDYAAEIRRGVARNATAAANIRVALQKQYGDDAKAMYPMFWEYSLDALKSENQANEPHTVGELVDYLDHDLLAVRRLAIWNLKQVTAGWDLSYRPEELTNQRKTAVRRWNDRLSSGDLWRRVSEASQAKTGLPPATSTNEASPR